MPPLSYISEGAERRTLLAPHSSLSVRQAVKPPFALSSIPISFQLPKLPPLLESLGKAVTPAAVAIGETHGYNVAIPLLHSGGNFALISTDNARVAYFGSKAVTDIPRVFGGWGVGVVGTAWNGNNQAGIGLSRKFGDVFVFLNFRQDAIGVKQLLSPQQMMDRIQKGNFMGLKITFGVCFSAPDAVIDAALNLIPNFGKVIAGARRAMAAKPWVGLAWSVASLNYKNGKLESIKVGHLTIPMDNPTKALEQAANCPPVKPPPRVRFPARPNRGDAAVASVNDSKAMLSGESPWRVGYLAIRRDGKDIRVRNGTIDVLNHGNRATAVTEPFYELGVAYRVIEPGYQIKNNADAGRIAEGILRKAQIAIQGAKNDVERQFFQRAYLMTLARLMNTYDLNFGSQLLGQAYRRIKAVNQAGNPANMGQGRTDNWEVSDLIGMRAELGLTPLLLPGDRPPADYKAIRHIFSGGTRYPGDMPGKVPPACAPKPPARK
ncbi:hypothetical protein SAMN06265795_11432 [Noviherbaspirillum humi]|uniref:Uncharacterized protein n=1 Tax=Noviherbaspirillum humi TaxID=1688639 RepID=A0A239JXG9_9BURK|nr:hypothetical protein [Noviherbaspirillum humi]SNT10657.1 hypothetical protein SAMN06265795_11432 [Noviherbaspirillum humi]